MRPLTSDDPEEIGGHRLLARLGAGGMGVVYLARSAGGALVALKTIRAEHAADPAFRARFRREVTAVRGLAGDWLVPVVAAGPEAREPWLASEFVPGPSLTEAVDGFGALPVAAVRVLGSRLADALTAVHAAGLVHRDVKPGNVLLTLDGPRLIDFGIAHASGATALTAPDAVIGTPGFLAPEQARARGGEVGPASDVFSLGCVLAYAASGRRPFGAGHAAGVLFRTVHEEPDLSDVPGELRALIAGCLAKDPAGRPTAVRLAASLRDPRLGPAASGGPGRDWLPPALLRVVAERSARALEVPTPQRAQEPVPDAGPPLAQAPPSRRRVLLLGSAAASVLAAGGGVTGYLVSRRGGAGLPVHVLGFQGDFSGASTADSEAQERGARLAVERYNARDGVSFRLALETVDDRGEPARAADAARRLVARGAVAVLGLGTATAARAAAPVYEAARTAMLLVSSDGAELSGLNLSTVFATRGPESQLALPLLTYLSSVHPVDRTGVIDDHAAGPTGTDLVSALSRAGTAVVRSVAAGSSDFAPAVRGVLAARAQAVVFTGVSPERASLCARALTDAGFTGPRLGTWHLMRPAFSPPAREGWVFGAPFTDPGSVSPAFTAAHRTRYGTAPARWSPEAYDAVGLAARALERTGTTADVPPGVLAQQLSGTAYTGLAKPLRFTSGNLALEGVYFLYQARGSAFRLLGRHDEV
ncbi:bifunctional serine/threonine-protein kinase/ABC transporter substrate-binding protein [Streptomyces niveiscabiei]|uniref:Bifunctional serine/threonine-protein kinase/ABC transporter substrate-binding protein n=1 Tax=Streptomyces niveiscabiei TaxID=164115 RepID=A0ABW9I1X8_9ACTN